MVVIWEPMYPGDTRRDVNAGLFNDPRVTTFWDPTEISGHWFGTHRLGRIEGGIVWDAYYAFAPTTRWSDQPDHLVASGAPIIGGVGELQGRFAPLLA
jgi:hypothetical protein